MDQYKLTVYESLDHNQSSEQPNLTWIELLDMKRETSHIFSFIPGNQLGVLGGCGLFKKNNTIPSNVHTSIRMSLSETTFTEMVKEGNCLHNQFILYDDGKEVQVANFN